MPTYCELTTCMHCYSVFYRNVCVQEINEIFREEGGEGVLFGRHVALNMDKLERFLAPDDLPCSARIDRQPSVDMVLGVCEKGSKHALLLVEMKLRVTAKNKPSDEEIRRKMNASRCRLGDFMLVREDCYVVFSSLKYPQEQNRYRKKLKGRQAVYVPITEELLYQEFFQD